MSKNTVELIGHYGNDTIHALSAWTSTSREINDDKVERIPKLLTMLAGEGHHTPFEKSMFHFLVNVEQASHIHILKHRIGVAVNGESARYKELKEDKMYIPEDWRGIEVKSEEIDVLYGNGDWYKTLENFTKEANNLYHKCLEELTPILGRKRAKESARFFKTMNSQITLDVSFNWRSFAHFYHLRAHDTAQLEIQEIAEQMLQQIKDIPGNPFKETINAFNL
jgi:flavin-dependent thymidylate synthase